MRRTALLAVGGWLAAVVAATIAGVAVLTLVGQSLLGSSPDEPMSSEQIAAALAGSTPPASTPPATPPPSTPPPSTPAASAVVVLLTTPGGTVIARCSGGQVVLRSWSPASGFTADEVRPGPEREARVTFIRGDEEIEARVRCGVGGRPRIQWKRD